MLQLAPSTPPSLSNHSCRERSPAGSGTAELLGRFHRQRVRILMLNSSQACWSTCSALAQAGRAGTLRQWHWIPAGSWPSPCTHSTGMSSGKGPSLTRVGMSRPVPWPSLEQPWPMVPMAEAVLVVLLVGEELRGTQVDLIFSFYCCQKTPGNCVVRVLGQGGQWWDRPPSTRPVIPSSGSSLTLPALITCSIPLLILPFPSKKRRMAGTAPTTQPAPLQVFEMVKKCINPISIQWGFMAAVIWQECGSLGGPRRCHYSLGRGQIRAWRGMAELAGLAGGGKRSPVAPQAMRQLISLCQLGETGILKAFPKHSPHFQEPGKGLTG